MFCANQAKGQVILPFCIGLGLWIWPFRGPQVGEREWPFRGRKSYEWAYRGRGVHGGIQGQSVYVWGDVKPGGCECGEWQRQTRNGASMRGARYVIHRSVAFPYFLSSYGVSGTVLGARGLKMSSSLFLLCGFHLLERMLRRKWPALWWLERRGQKRLVKDKGVLEKMRGEKVENFLLELSLDRVSGTPFIWKFKTARVLKAKCCCSLPWTWGQTHLSS